jgi:hypothetical protein
MDIIKDILLYWIGQIIKFVVLVLIVFSVSFLIFHTGNYQGRYTTMDDGS